MPPGNFIEGKVSALGKLDSLTNSMGVFGFTAVKDTNQRVGKFTSLRIMVAATFSQLKVTNSATDALLNVSFPAGHEILGPVESFTLSAGTVIAYHAEGQEPV